MAKHRVADFMSRKVVSLRPDASVREAEALLAKHGIGGAPVVDEHGRVRGVVSQRDLVRLEATPATAGQSGEFYTDMEEFRDLAKTPVERHGTPVEKVMTTNVIQVGPDAEVAEAARTMRAHRVHRLLVIDGQVLVGILTAQDLLRALEEQPATP